MFWLFFWCGFDSGRTLAAVLCPWSRFVSLRAWPLCVCGFVVSVFLPARLLVALCGCRAPFCGCLGPLCVCLVCLAVVGSPPCRLLLPFPLRLVPCGALAQFSRWSLPLGIWLLFVTAWLPCFIAGSVVVLCRPYFMLSHGSKGLWPCVGLFSLYTMMHVLLGCSVLPC